MPGGPWDPWLRGVAARWKPCKDPPLQPLAAREAALSGKGAGPELGRRRRGWIVSPPVSLLAARPSGSAGSSRRQPGFPLTCGAGSPGWRSPSTMILWLWLCWGFSTSAGQPDSELMARYLEEKLLADYSIMEQVGFKAVVVWEHLVAEAGSSPLNHQC